MKNLAILLILVLSPLLIDAQSPSFNSATNQSIYSQSIQLYRSTLTQLFDKETVTPSLDQALALLNTRVVDTVNWQYAALQTQKDLLKKQNGLKAFVSYGMNGDEEAINDLGDHRWRYGIQWEVLNGGFGEKASELKKLEVAQELTLALAEYERKTKQYGQKYQDLIQLFNTKKMNHFEKILAFQKAKHQIVKKLYHAHELRFEEVLKAEQQIADAAWQLQTYQTFNSATKAIGTSHWQAITADDLPLLAVDLNALLKDTVAYQYFERIAQLNQESVRLKYDTGTDIRLNVFAFGQNNWTPENDATLAMGMGGRLTVPLNFTNQQEKELSRVEQQIIQEDLAWQELNYQKELAVLYQEYGYKMKQYLNFCYKKVAQEEKIRLQSALLNNRPDAYSPMQGLANVEQYLHIETELIDLKQQLYLLLLKMANRCIQTDMSPYVSIQEMNAFGDKFIGQRAIVLQKRDLQKYSTPFLVAYLRKNEFEIIVMPKGIDGSVFRAEDWTPKVYYQQAQEEGIATYEANGNQITTYQLAGVQQYECVPVPSDLFLNRHDLELWLTSKTQKHPQHWLLFQGIDWLITLDEAELGLVSVVD